MEKRPHLDENCPGADYFKRRDTTYKSEMREVMTEVLGDIPKHMRMTVTNRTWLILLTFAVFISLAFKII